MHVTSYGVTICKVVQIVNTTRHKHLRDKLNFRKVSSLQC